LEFAFDLAAIAVPFIALVATCAFRRFCDDGISLTEAEFVAHKTDGCIWGRYNHLEQTNKK
jgi:hypothetical protein